MRWVRIAGCFVGLVACLVMVGCGGGGSSSAGTTAGGGAAPGGSRVARGGATGGSPSAGAANGRRAIHEPVQTRGTKGEDPRAEAATTARISAGDCAALGRL